MSKNKIIVHQENQKNDQLLVSLDEEIINLKEIIKNNNLSFENALLSNSPFNLITSIRKTSELEGIAENKSTPSFKNFLSSTTLYRYELVIKLYHGFISLILLRLNTSKNHDLSMDITSNYQDTDFHLHYKYTDALIHIPRRLVYSMSKDMSFAQNMITACYRRFQTTDFNYFYTTKGLLEIKDIAFKAVCKAFDVEIEFKDIVSVLSCAGIIDIFMGTEYKPSPSNLQLYRPDTSAVQRCTVSSCTNPNTTRITVADHVSTTDVKDVYVTIDQSYLYTDMTACSTSYNTTITSYDTTIDVNDYQEKDDQEKEEQPKNNRYECWSYDLNLASVFRRNYGYVEIDFDRIKSVIDNERNCKRKLTKKEIKLLKKCVPYSWCLEYKLTKKDNNSQPIKLYKLRGVDSKFSNYKSLPDEYEKANNLLSKILFFPGTIKKVSKYNRIMIDRYICKIDNYINYIKDTDILIFYFGYTPELSTKIILRKQLLKQETDLYAALAIAINKFNDKIKDDSIHISLDKGRASREGTNFISKVTSPTLIEKAMKEMMKTHTIRNEK